MYNVYKIDISWDEYDLYEVYVGANDINDLFAHIKDIFPDDIHIVHREDWMNDEDWEEETEYGRYKEGETICTPYFSDEQLSDLKKVYNTDTYNYSRIQEIPHLYTDTPYTILETNVTFS